MASIGEAVATRIADRVVDGIVNTTMKLWKDYKINEYVDGIVNAPVKIWKDYKFSEYVGSVERNGELLAGLELDEELEVKKAKWGRKLTGDLHRFWEIANEIMKEKGILLEDANKVNRGFWKGRLNVFKRLSLSRKAQKLNARIDELLSQGQKFIKRDHDFDPPIELLPAYSIYDGSDLESRDKLMGDVMKALQKDENYVVGIWGRVGVGKTMLADEVLSRVLYEQLFDATVKVEVSKHPSIPEIQSVIVKQLGLTLDEETKEAGIAQRVLSKLVNGSKILVLLDDVRDELLLHKIGLPLHGEQAGCKVLVTCQNYSTLKTMQATKCIKVKPLSRPEARQLFNRIVRDFAVEDIAENILNECAGLPLAITSVAWALRNSDPNSWERVLCQVKESTVPDEFDLEKSLYLPIKVSYNLLESEPRRLLLLCCLFPEGADIPIQKLVRYVKGLQLLKVFDSLLNTSNYVLSLLNDLTNYSLLLHGDKDMTVTINHVVRAVCLSISSNEDKNRKHTPKLMKWPYDNEQRQPCTGISLTSGDQMQLDYPDRELLQLQSHGDFLNLSVDNFKGMREVRVLDSNGKTPFYKSNQIPAFLPVLNILTNLRTLCIEFCDFSDGDLSQIEKLKDLEVLSFFCSKLDSLPIQIQQLTNLKLLDLRCFGPVIIPGKVLPALTKLEELYLGSYNSWLPTSRIQSDEGGGIMITVLSNLPLLRVLQIQVNHPSIFLELKEEAWFERLVKFHITVTQDEPSFHEYEIGKSIILHQIEWSSLLNTKIQKLLKITECLILRYTTFRNLFVLCQGLKTLELEGGDVKFIMETEDSASTLNKLKHLKIQSMDNLLAICDGNLWSASLVNLETVMLDNLPKLKYLWSARYSACLDNLRVIEMANCGAITCIFPFYVAQGLNQLEKLDIKSCKMLKWIVSKDEDERRGRKIVLPKLSYFSLDDLPDFRSFFSGTAVKSSIKNPITRANHEMRGHSCFALKWKASRTKKQLASKNIAVPTLVVFDQDVEEHIKSTLFNQLVELPSMNKLMISSMSNMKYIVDEQTSMQTVSEIILIHVTLCENLLSLAASGNSITSLRNLKQVKVEKCASMETLFDFGECNVENSNKEVILTKLETITLLKLNSLKNVFWMVPETSSCFQNLKSLEISDCRSLKYIFSVSVAKCLRKLEDLKVTNCAMVEEIIEMDGRSKEEMTGRINFSRLRVLQLDDLPSMSSFSSGNIDFNFPELQDMLVRKCPSMTRFCDKGVKARKLYQVRVGDLHTHLQVQSQDALNEIITQLHIDRDRLNEVSDEIEEV